MFDLLYVVGTFAFFGLMLAYVAACARLGRSTDESSQPSETRT